MKNMKIDSVLFALPKLKNKLNIAEFVIDVLKDLTTIVFG
jgi:hypothetical protein